MQYVHRDPVDAFRGTLDRAMNSPAERGRVIPLQLREDLHRGSAEAIERIQQKYADNPNVKTQVVVNSQSEQPRIGSIDDVKKERATLVWGINSGMSPTKNLPPAVFHAQSTIGSVKDPDQHVNRTQEAMLKALDRKRLEHQARQQ